MVGTPHLWKPPKCVVLPLETPILHVSINLWAKPVHAMIWHSLKAPCDYTQFLAFGGYEYPKKGETWV